MINFDVTPVKPSLHLYSEHLHNPQMCLHAPLQSLSASVGATFTYVQQLLTHIALSQAAVNLLSVTVDEFSRDLGVANIHLQLFFWMPIFFSLGCLLRSRLASVYLTSTMLCPHQQSTGVQFYLLSLEIR